MNSFNYGLFALRHCKTQNNIEKRISGQSDSLIIDYSVDISILDQEVIYKLGLNVITSPAPRCLKTIDVIKQHIPGKITIQTDERLLERHMGLWEGKFKKSIMTHTAWETINEHINPYHTPPNGESISKCIKRIDEFLIDLEHNSLNTPIMICGHNQTLKLLKFQLFKLPNLIDFWKAESFENGKVERLL